MKRKASEQRKRARPAKAPKKSGAALAHVPDERLPAEAPQTLRGLYDRWLAVRLAHASWLAEHRRRSEALASKAAYLLGSMEAAKRFLGKGKGGELRAMTGEVSAAGAEARKALEREHKERLARHRREEAEVLKALAAMADRYLRHHRPELVFRVHPIGGGKAAIVQTGDISRDDAVLLVYVLTGKFPTRHDFFDDEAVLDAAQGVSRWYGNEGVPRAVIEDEDRADAEILSPARRVLPIRTFIPLPLPKATGPRFRIVCQGAVGELESRRKGASYGNRVPTKDLELLSGYLISLHVGGKIAFRVDWPERGE